MQYGYVTFPGYLIHPLTENELAAWAEWAALRAQGPWPTPTTKNPHIGSSLSSFMDEEGDILNAADDPDYIDPAQWGKITEALARLPKDERPSDNDIEPLV